MRRKERAVTAPAAIREILDQCQVCRLALWDREGPYIVPMSFGYTYEDGQLALYFHSALEGRKIDALQKDPRAAFELDCQLAVRGGETACGYTCLYRSVTGTGTVTFLTDPADKRRALAHIMARQTGREDFAIPDQSLDRVAVFRLDAETFSGKQNI